MLNNKMVHPDDNPVRRIILPEPSNSMRNLFDQHKRVKVKGATNSEANWKSYHEDISTVACLFQTFVETTINSLENYDDLYRKAVATQ